MVLARAWRRRLYASLGLSVLLPAALLCAVALLALNVGFPGLASLGQAFSGPSLAAAAAPVLGAAATGAHGMGAVAGGAAAAPPRASSGLLAAAPGHRAASGPTSRVPSAPGVHRQTGSGGVGGGPGTGGSRTGSRTGAGGNPGSAPSQPHRHSGNPGSSPIDPVVRTVTSVTSKLPPPVGPAATKAANTAGSVVKKVIKHLPSTTGSVVKGVLPKAHVPKLPLG